LKKISEKDSEKIFSERGEEE